MLHFNPRLLTSKSQGRRRHRTVRSGDVSRKSNVMARVELLEARQLLTLPATAALPATGGGSGTPPSMTINSIETTNIDGRVASDTVVLDATIFVVGRNTDPPLANPTALELVNVQVIDAGDNVVFSTTFGNLLPDDLNNVVNNGPAATPFPNSDLTLTGLSGTNVLRLRLTGGTAPRTATSGTFTITVDQTGPEVASFVLAPGNVLNRDVGDGSVESVTINFDATDTNAATFTQSGDLTLTRDGNDVTIPDGRLTQDDSDTWTLDVTGLNDADGTYVLTVNEAGLADDLGNDGTGTESVTWTQDLTVPMVGIPKLDAADDTRRSTLSADDFTASDGITSQTTNITITGTSTDGDAVTVDILNDGTTTVVDTMTVTAIGGMYTAEFAAVAEGIFDLRATADDGVNDPVESALGSLVIDATDPAAPSTPDLQSGSDSGTSNSDNITDDQTPTFDISGVEADARIDLRRDGSSVTSDAPAATQTLASIADTAVPDGTHAYTLIQTDLAGNASTASSGLSVAIDDTDPQIMNVSLSVTDNEFVDTVLTIDVTAEDDPGITFDLTDQKFQALTNTVAFEIVQINADATETVLGTSMRTFTAEGSDESESVSLSLDASSIASGLITLQVRATDTAGNTASSQLQVFALDAGADTPNVPGTPIFTEFYPLADILDPLDQLGRNQVWQMGFDKTTQTIFINTELGTETFQFDPATGAVRVFNLLPLDPTQPTGTNPHGIFYDFDTFLTPRVFIAHRTAGGATANIMGSVEGARLSYYDLVPNEFVTYDFQDGVLGVDVEDLHAVAVDDTGTVWSVGTHSNTVFEIRMNKLDPSDRSATVIPHIVPAGLADGFDEEFVPHGIDIIVDERTGEQYVWLIAEGGTGRIALLRPRFNPDGTDVWVTWDVDEQFEGARGTFLKVDNRETPGIPDDDVIIGTFPVARPAISNGGGGSQNPGGSPSQLVGVLQVLDPGSVALNPNDLSDPGTMRMYVLPQIPGGTGDLAADNQPYLDREGRVYYADRTGGIARLALDEITPVLVDDMPQDRVIIVSSSPSAAVVLQPDVFDAAPLLTVGNVTPTHPALTAFDTDGSGDLSLTEIAAGNPALIRLDINSDNIVTADELPLRETDRSSVDGLDQYEVAGLATPRISGQGRGPFRGTINAGSIVFGSVAQSDTVSSSAFAETSRRRVSVVTSPGGGRMVFQTLRDGSLVMTARDDGDLFDEQTSLTREIVLRQGLVEGDAGFDQITMRGDPSAIREDDGSVHVFGKNSNNNMVVYQFDPTTGLWTASEIEAPIGSVLAGNPIAFQDGARGPAAVITTSDGQLVLFRPDGSTLDLTALATDPTAARVYGNPGIVDDVSTGRVYAYGSDMAGNVVEYRFARSGVINNTSLSAETLVIADAVRADGQVLRDTFIVQGVDVAVSNGIRHVFGTDGHSRVVHLEVTGDASVGLAENISQILADTTSDNTIAADGSNVDTNGDDRVTGYFAFQMPFVARVYTEIAPVVEADGSLTLYGTNGGDLVLFREQSGEWSAANLSKDVSPDTPGNFTPANFVFGASDAYIDAVGDRHSLQINADGEIVEFLFDRSTGRFSTQNINLARNNDILDLARLDAPADVIGGATETIVDNGGAGYAVVLGNSTAQNSGLNGDQEVLGGTNGPNDGTSIAQWEFTGLAAGSYRVSATWAANARNAGNSVYVVMTGGSTAGQIRINQQQTPEDFANNGAFWQDLLPLVAVNDGTLTVLLGDDANGRVIADAIRIERIDALQATGGEAAVSVSDAAITTRDVSASFEQAVLILTATVGLTPEQILELDSLTPVVTDLSGGLLGGISGNQLLLDVNAAGYGWHIDATPGLNEEFANSGYGQLQAQSGTAAEGRIDLLTVLLHEMSHALDFDHDDGSEHSLLSEELAPGQRHLPEADVDLQFSADGGMLDVL
jgi:hypothetical protein